MSDHVGLVLPIVHLNGTSRDALLDQRCKFGQRLREAMEALSEMAPNGRDYYPDPPRMALAVTLHNLRMLALKSLFEQIQAEAVAIAECDPRSSG